MREVTLKKVDSFYKESYEQMIEFKSLFYNLSYILTEY